LSPITPRRTNLLHNALHLPKAAECSVVIGFSEPRAQNVIAAENVKRQIAVAVIVAVKETPLLLAVQRQVRSVHVQNNLDGSFLVRLDEYLIRFRVLLPASGSARFSFPC